MMQDGESEEEVSEFEMDASDFEESDVCGMIYYVSKCLGLTNMDLQDDSEDYSGGDDNASEDDYSGSEDDDSEGEDWDELERKAAKVRLDVSI